MASAVKVPAYARSSHSGEGMAWASLDQDEALEDDFQTQHMPVCRMMWREDDGHQSSAEGRLEHSGAVDWVPDRHRQGRGDAGDSRPHLEGHPLAAVSGPGHRG